MPAPPSIPLADIAGSGTAAGPREATDRRTLAGSVPSAAATLNDVSTSKRLQIEARRYPLWTVAVIDNFGQALRALREATGMSIPAFAAKVRYSKGYIGNVETGERPPTPELAEACDRVLGAGGLLVELAAQGKVGGDDVKRRALLNGMALATGLGGANMGMLADAVRASLAAALGTPVSLDDWLALCEDHGRRCMTEPPAEMQRALVGDLLLLRQQIVETDHKQLRAVAARLTALYAMTIASMGDTHGAMRWYRTAKGAADTSEDRNLMAWVRGREVLRSDYDGYGKPDQILALVRDSAGLADAPSVGRMEIMVAAARAYARIGEHAQARAAYEESRRAYEATPRLATDAESMYYLPEWRFRLRGAFVYAMAGDTGEVDRILAEVASARPAGLVRWGVQSDLNRALAAACAGDDDSAVALGVTTVERTPKSQHTQTMRQLVGALCAAVPDGTHRDAGMHLRQLVA